MALIDIVPVASESEPETPRMVRWDTDHQWLTCPCEGWTRRRHMPTCAAVVHGLSCTCARQPREVRTVRTCKHVRAVATQVAAAGGLPTVLLNLRSGRPPFAETGAARATATLDAALNGLRRTRGVPLRTVLNATGYAETTGLVPGVPEADVVYVRADGWTLGAPAALSRTAWEQHRGQWIAAIDVRREPWVVERDVTTPLEVVHARCVVPGCRRPQRPRSPYCTEHRTMTVDPRPLYVLAETHQIARSVAEQDLGLSPDDWRYADTERTVRGAGPGIRYACVEGFWRRPEAMRVLEILRSINGSTEVDVRAARQAAPTSGSRIAPGGRGIILRD